MSDTLAKVTGIISSHLNVSAEDVKPESKLVDDLGADSLDQVELIMAFEEEFSIEISDDEAGDIVSVKDVISAIEKKSVAA